MDYSYPPSERDESVFADEDSVAGDHRASSVAPDSNGRRLTDLDNIGSDDEQGGSNADEEEEEQDEDEEEEGSDNNRPKKRKRRKRGGNQFIDIEAEVDDDEEEDEDEGEEGFVATDDFIVNRPDRRELARDLTLPEDMDYNDDEADGDSSHRLLDRRLNAQKNAEAEALAAQFDNQYKNSKYSSQGAEEWAPKALLMPGVNDPSIWGIKCRPGRERELVLSLSRKAAALAASDNAIPLRIISAFNRDSIKGYIYVEAREESHVRSAVAGLIGVYTNSDNGVFLVDIEEMPDLLKTKQKRVETKPGSWVRIKRGKYAGDLGQIVDSSENGEEITLKFIPRIDLTPRDEGMQVGSDGKKRKKGAATPLAFRPPQRKFNPEEIGKIYGKREVSKRPQGVLVFKGDTYKDGYLEKDIKISGLVIDDVQPTLDELTRFLGEGATDGESGLDLSAIAEQAKKSAKSTLQPGDMVEIWEGDQKGLYGSVDSVAKDQVYITPHEDLDLGAIKLQVSTSMVRKRFKTGDHVKVMAGSNIDETGLVVQVKDDVVTFMSDLSLQEVTVFSKDVRKAAEVGSGVNVIGQYELHDLVQIDPQTTGVIFRIERDIFRILDQAGTVRSLKPSQVGIKLNSRDSVATDAEGFDIKVGDRMKETSGPNTIQEGRQGNVLHIYRSIYAFLHNREITANGGVFVTYARSLTSTTTRGSSSALKSRPDTQLNPDRFAQPVNPGVQPGMSLRRDGRIHRKVSVTKGQYKGLGGVIKDVVGTTARVELHTNSKVVTVGLESLKEQKSDGTLIELVERQGGPGGGYGGRAGFSREGSTSSNQSSAGNNNRPAYNNGKTPVWSGGRTPAPQQDGGRTPAGGASGAWTSGRTPAYGGGGSSSAWNASSRTPAHPSSSSDTWNPSSRTPHHAPSDPWNASSRTPHHGGSFANDGGRTPDPRAGGRTPAYGARGGPSNTQTQAATPGVSGWENDDWDTAPTPAAAPTPAPPRQHDYSQSQAKTPYEAPTPWSSAPTPGAQHYSAPTPAAAPTPGAYSAPTPAAYAPTPGGYNAASTPGGYGSAPTPGGFGNSAPTPGGYPMSAATPYAGAATSAAQPVEFVPRAKNEYALTDDWVIAGMRVTIRDGQYAGQLGYVAKLGGRSALVVLDNTQQQIPDCPTSSLGPVSPFKPQQNVYVISGPYKGYRAMTLSRDGNDWMIEVSGKQQIVDQRVLTLKQ